MFSLSLLLALPPPSLDVPSLLLPCLLLLLLPLLLLSLTSGPSGPASNAALGLSSSTASCHESDPLLWVGLPLRVPVSLGGPAGDCALACDVTGVTGVPSLDDVADGDACGSDKAGGLQVPLVLGSDPLEGGRLPLLLLLLQLCSADALSRVAAVPAVMVFVLVFVLDWGPAGGSLIGSTLDLLLAGLSLPVMVLTVAVMVPEVGVDDGEGCGVVAGEAGGRIAGEPGLPAVKLAPLGEVLATAMGGGIIPTLGDDVAGEGEDGSSGPIGLVT